MDRFLIPMQKKLGLKSSIYKEPDTVFDTATIMVEQAKDANDPHLKGTLLKRVIALLQTEAQALAEATLHAEQQAQQDRKAVLEQCAVDGVAPPEEPGTLHMLYREDYCTIAIVIVRDFTLLFFVRDYKLLLSLLLLLLHDCYCYCQGLHIIIFCQGLQIITITITITIARLLLLLSGTSHYYFLSGTTNYYYYYYYYYYTIAIVIVRDYCYHVLSGTTILYRSFIDPE